MSNLSSLYQRLFSLKIHFLNHRSDPSFNTRHLAEEFSSVKISSNPVPYNLNLNFVKITTLSFYFTI